MYNISMTNEEIEIEVNSEFEKNSRELAKDIWREANKIPQEPANEKENLDIIKHLIKRLTVHQIVLQDRINKTNCWLIVLSVIMAIGALFSILSYFK